MCVIEKAYFALEKIQELMPLKLLYYEDKKAMRTKVLMAFNFIAIKLQLFFNPLINITL